MISLLFYRLLFSKIFGALFALWSNYQTSRPPLRQRKQMNMVNSHERFTSGRESCCALLRSKLVVTGSDCVGKLTSITRTPGCCGGSCRYRSYYAAAPDARLQGRLIYKTNLNEMDCNIESGSMSWATLWDCLSLHHTAFFWRPTF